MQLATLVLVVATFLVAACRAPSVRPGSSGSGASGSAVSGATVSPAAGTAAAVSADERQWARQALQALDTLDAAVQDYHQSTAVPVNSSRQRQLRTQAYAGFRQAVAQYQTLWPVTQQIGDASVRDPFIFVFGNIGGFLNPNPDLPGDPGPPTLGDRVGRSLENAISSAASVRPQLERLTAQH